MSIKWLLMLPFVLFVMGCGEEVSSTAQSLDPTYDGGGGPQYDVGTPPQYDVGTPPQYDVGTPPKYDVGGNTGGKGKNCVRVIICHHFDHGKVKSMSICENDWAKHQNHGDTMGPCQ